MMSADMSRLRRATGASEDVIEAVASHYLGELWYTILRKVFLPVIAIVVLGCGVLPSLLHFTYRMILLYVAANFGSEFLATTLEIIQLW